MLQWNCSKKFHKADTCVSGLFCLFNSDKQCPQSIKSVTVTDTRKKTAQNTPLAPYTKMKESALYLSRRT